jgi:hypothetical protein
MRRTSFLLLAACGGSPGQPSPSEYIFGEGELPEPTAALADVEGALQEGLDLALTLDASPVEAAYNSAMAGSTAQCPYVYTTAEGAYWFDSCTSPGGTEFDGYVYSVSGSGVYDPNTGLLLDYWTAFGGATVRDPQDHVFEIAGTAVRYRGTTEYAGTDVSVSATQLSGTFAWDGPSAAGTWLEDGLDTDFTTQVYSIPLLNAAQIALVGGFGGYGDGWSIAFDENVVTSESVGGLCEDELSGTVAVRAPDGAWYDVMFQGWDGVATDYDGAQCDGCGDVYYEGVAVGVACVDLSEMFATAVSL